MTGRRLAVLFFCWFGLAAGQNTDANDDVVLRAMRDELNRSRKLRVVNLEAPYYVEYSVHDGESLAISATLGALLESTWRQFRQPGVKVRVGGHSFDNSNYILSDLTFGSRYNLGQMPLDDSYDALRQYLWLATDSTYKSALEAIARKRAALKHINVSEQIDDFAKAEPARTVLKIQRETADEEGWKAMVRRLSAVFGDHPKIIESSVRLEAVQGVFYFVNAEGTEVRIPEKLVYVLVKASAQAPDGMALRDAVVFHSREFGRMRSEAEMREGVLEVARNLVALTEAPPGEAYSGPVLFEGQGSAQLFAELLGRNLDLQRRPVSEPGRPIPFVESEFEGRFGSRILPEWMDVEDDPTKKEWQGRPIIGHYTVDLEGVRPEPLKLVTKGVLTNFLLTRQPAKDLPISNGRARLPGRFGANTAAFGNLFVRASETVPLADLKKRMLDLCQKRSKPYGIIVRKMDFPSSVPLGQFRSLLSKMAQASGSNRPVSLPVLVYRLYADGREELVRGLQLKGLTTRSLRDIIAASDEQHVLDFLNNTAPFALMGAGGYVAESSVIAPSVLFDDLQLDRLEEELPKPPVVPSPPLTAAR